MSTEIRIEHGEIQSPEGITKVVENKFKEKGLSYRVHEVISLADDFRKRVRYLKVKSTKYYDMKKGRR